MSQSSRWQGLCRAIKESKYMNKEGKRPMVHVVWVQGRAYAYGFTREGYGSQDGLQLAVEALCGIPVDKQVVGCIIGCDGVEMTCRFYRRDEVGFNLLLYEKDLVWVI